MRRGRVLTACAATAAVLAALSVAASSGDTEWRAFMLGGEEQHAMVVMVQGATGPDPHGSTRACLIFRLSGAVELPDQPWVMVISDNAERGPDAGVRGAARAMADWAEAHNQVNPVPARLASAMRAACYVWETSRAGVVDAAVHSSRDRSGL